MRGPGQTRSRHWRDIALAADRKPRSTYAIAKEIGTQAGAIQSAVDSMCAERLLRAKSTTRGQIYALTSKGRRALEEADRAIDARRALPGDARVLLIVDEGRSIPPDLLAELAAEPTLAWSLRLDGIVRWLAVFQSEDAVSVDRAAARVEAAGARPIVERADRIYNASELADYAMRLSRSRPALRT